MTHLKQLAVSLNVFPNVSLKRGFYSPVSLENSSCLGSSPHTLAIKVSEKCHSK